MKIMSTEGKKEPYEFDGEDPRPIHRLSNFIVYACNDEGLRLDHFKTELPEPPQPANANGHWCYDIEGVKGEITVSSGSPTTINLTCGPSGRSGRIIKQWVYDFGSVDSRGIYIETDEAFYKLENPSPERGFSATFGPFWRRANFYVQLGSFLTERLENATGPDDLATLDRDGVMNGLRLHISNEGDPFSDVTTVRYIIDRINYKEFSPRAPERLGRQSLQQVIERRNYNLDQMQNLLYFEMMFHAWVNTPLCADLYAIAGQPLPGVAYLEGKKRRFQFGKLTSSIENKRREDDNGEGENEDDEEYQPPRKRRRKNRSTSSNASETVVLDLVLDEEIEEEEEETTRRRRRKRKQQRPRQKKRRRQRERRPIQERDGGDGDLELPTLMPDRLHSQIPLPISEEFFVEPPLTIPPPPDPNLPRCCKCSLQVPNTDYYLCSKCSGRLCENCLHERSYFWQLRRSQLQTFDPRFVDFDQLKAWARGNSFVCLVCMDEGAEVTLSEIEGAQEDES